MNNKKLNREYMDYLLSDMGLLSDYDLFEADITFDEYDDPSDEVIEKLENYKDKLQRKN